MNVTRSAGAVLLMLALTCAVARASGPAAGLYQLRSPLGWCVGYRAGDGVARLPYLAMGDCQKLYQRNAGTALPAILLGIPIGLAGSETLGYSPIAIVPHPLGGYTLRSTKPYLARTDNSGDGTRLGSCVTVARGVLIGPPGIDVWACDQDGAWARAGGTDQRFYLTPVEGDGNYTISYIGSSGDNRVRYCIDVRGASQDINTDLISWECNGQKNQIFHLTSLGPLTTSDDIATARAVANANLASSLTVTVPIAPPAPPPTSQGGIQRSVNFPGMDIGGSDTSDDRGRMCRALCVASLQCHAFSWVRPGVQGPSARCWLKSGVSSSVPDPNVNSGTVTH